MIEIYPVMKNIQVYYHLMEDTIGLCHYIKEVIDINETVNIKYYHSFFFHNKNKQYFLGQC